MHSNIESPIRHHKLQTKRPSKPCALRVAGSRRERLNERTPSICRVASATHSTVLSGNRQLNSVEQLDNC
jgi:hypothetical protein